MSISMIPTRFDDSPVALHAISNCFIRAGKKAYPQLKKHLRADAINFRYFGDLLVQEDRFLRNCADYNLYRNIAPVLPEEQGPYIFIIAADTFSWHHVDKRLEAYLGYRLHELENDWVIAYHPDSCEATDEDMTHIMRSLYNGVCNYAELDIRYQTKPGYSVWAHQTMSLVRDWEGNPEFFLTVIRDISMQRWAQLLYSEMLALKNLMDESYFHHRTASWIDGLLRHYEGKPIDGKVMHQLRVLVRDLV